jgi:propanediol dehydratase small subunit
MNEQETRTLSGRKLEELRIEAVLSKELQLEDFRISAETLRRQAQTARDAGYPQLAENLLRAAELTRISNEELLEIYSKLRPGRTTHADMTAIADRLEKHFDAPLTAEFIREAANIYRRRALVRETADR